MKTAPRCQWGHSSSCSCSGSSSSNSEGLQDFIKRLFFLCRILQPLVGCATSLHCPLLQLLNTARCVSPAPLSRLIGRLPAPADQSKLSSRKQMCFKEIRPEVNGEGRGVAQVRGGNLQLQQSVASLVLRHFVVKNVSGFLMRRCCPVWLIYTPARRRADKRQSSWTDGRVQQWKQTVGNNRITLHNMKSPLLIYILEIQLNYSFCPDRKKEDIDLAGLCFKQTCTKKLAVKINQRFSHLVSKTQLEKSAAYKNLHNYSAHFFYRRTRGRHCDLERSWYTDAVSIKIWLQCLSGEVNPWSLSH